MRLLCRRGAKLLRLDAFGYVTKKLGTPCLFEVRESSIWKYNSLHFCRLPCSTASLAVTATSTMPRYLRFEDKIVFAGARGVGISGGSGQPHRRVWDGVSHSTLNYTLPVAM